MSQYAAGKGRPPHPVRQQPDQHSNANGPCRPAVLPKRLHHTLQPLGTLELQHLLGEKVTPHILALSRTRLCTPSGLEHAVLTDADLPRRPQVFRWIPVKQLRGRRDESFKIERLGQLAEDGMEHFGLVGFRLKELSAPVEDDLGKHVDREDGLARKQHVKEPCDFVLRLYVVCVHGERARQGEEWLCLREVGPELGVRGVQDARDEAELGYGGFEVWEHEITYSEERESGHGGATQARREDEEEDLGNIVVALEIVDVGIAAQNREDKV